MWIDYGNEEIKEEAKWKNTIFELQKKIWISFLLIFLNIVVVWEQFNSSIESNANYYIILVSIKSSKEKQLKTILDKMVDYIELLQEVIL